MGSALLDDIDEDVEEATYGNPLEMDDLLREIVTSAASQPDARTEWDKCAAYYDGHQDTDEIRTYREEHEMPDMTINLFQEAINSVLGHEEQRRVEWTIKPDDDSGLDMAEAVNQKILEHTRLLDANHHCSEAYKGQIVSGIGWLYVGKNSNPMDYPLDIHGVHRDEMIWDMRSSRHDLRDCQWLARRKYVDQQQAVSFLPEHEKLINETFTNWGEWDILPGYDSANEDTSTYSEYEGTDGTRHGQQLYMDGIRQMVALFEVYYKKYERRKLIMSHTSGRVQLYDGDNADHVLAVYNEESYITEHVVPIMYQAWFVGPYMVRNGPSPHPHNYFPYVMFRGYTEDKTNIPYGLGRGMLSPQDAYNTANNRMYHILNSKRIIMESSGASMLDENGEVMTADDIIHELNRKDGYLNIPVGAKLMVEQDWNELNKLENLKASAREEMRAASGISYSYTGQGKEQASGVAIQSLADMSTTTLAEINAKYQFGRTMVGRIVMAHSLDDIGSQTTDVNIKDSTGNVKKSVTLNNFNDPEQPDNDLQQARLSVVLADVATSDGFREHNRARVQEMFAGATDEMKPMLAKLSLELSNIPNREEVIAYYNKQLGMGANDDETAEMEKAASEKTAKAEDLANRLAEAEIEKALGQAAKFHAEAKALAEGAPIEQAKNIKEMENGGEQVAANDAEMEQKQANIIQMRKGIAERRLKQIAG